MEYHVLRIYAADVLLFAYFLYPTYILLSLFRFIMYNVLVFFLYI